MGSPAYLACSLVHRGNRTVRKRNMDWDGLKYYEILRLSCQKNYLTCFDSKSPVSQGMKYTWVLLSRKFHVHISLHVGFPECLWCQPMTKFAINSDSSTLWTSMWRKMMIGIMILLAKYSSHLKNPLMTNWPHNKAIISFPCHLMSCKRLLSKGGKRSTVKAKALVVINFA